MLAIRRAASIVPRCRARAFFSFPDLSSYSPSYGESQAFHERKILPYTQKQVYDLVADVNSYEHFLPFCTASRVLKRSPRLSEREPLHLEAELSVGFMGLTESYVSKVVCKPYHSVEATASSSTPLFDTLVTTWRFQPASPASPHASAIPAVAMGVDKARALENTPNRAPTLVSIDLVYAFAHPLHAQVSATFFSRVSKLMIQAFEERCIEVYGRQ